MKREEFIKKLAGTLEFKVKGNLVFKIENHLLKGIYMEGSRQADKYYIWILFTASFSNYLATQ